MLKKLGINWLIVALICSFSSGCAFKQRQYATSKNSEFLAMLLDPVVRKDFRAMKEEAKSVQLYQTNGRTYITAQDIKKLDELSAPLTNRLYYYYHLSSRGYKVRTFIGKHQVNSCYGYYDSSNRSSIGKRCGESGANFTNCNYCNAFIKSIKSQTRFNVVRARWLRNQRVIALVEPFKLRNGENAYLAFEVESSK